MDTLRDQLWKIKAWRYHLWDLVSRKWGKLLPNRVKMWAAYSVLATATEGKYDTTNVNELGALEAIGRYIKEKNIK